MIPLEHFRFYLKDLESPSHVIDWNYYFMIASTLGRKVWMGDTEFRIFPNLYLIFVGEPGSGKSLPASQAKDLVQNTLLVKRDPSGKAIESHGICNMAPDSCTLESLWIAMEKCLNFVTYKEGEEEIQYGHSSLVFYLADELATLFRDKTNDLIVFLTAAWDCRESFKQTTKHNGNVFIQKLCLNLLGCCPPDWISDKLGQQLIGSGLSARCIFVHVGAKRQLTTWFRVSEEQRNSAKEVKKHLAALAELAGPVKVDPAAYAWFDNWYQTQSRTRLNPDKRLAYYYERKRVHLMKLALNIHFGRSLSMTIGVEDFEDALRLLNMTEITMHKALAATGKNPVHALAVAIWDACKKSPMARIDMIAQFFDMGTVEDIDKAIEWLLATKAVELVGGDGSMVYKTTEKQIDL